MAKKQRVTLESLDKKIDRVITVLVTKADTGRIDELEKRIDKRFEQVMTAIDSLATNVGKMLLEYAAISAKLSRYEEWFKILAKKTGVKLPF